MARISGIELQDNWKVDFALTRIKGIGWPLAKKILQSLKIDSRKRISDLIGNELTKITAKVEEYPIEGELLRQVKTNITRLRNIGSYRGIRHARGLPVRGQRTRSNARTKRGKRKTVGAFKKETLAKVAAKGVEGGKEEK
jgi:small subunit ribosomal protein S13